MNTQPDFEELLNLLEQNSVRYMIIGGILKSILLARKIY